MSDGGLVNSSQQALIAEAWQMAAEQFRTVGFDLGAVITVPSAVYRPSVVRDGNQWSALYGDNLMEGVVGFGDSPAEAMADFDKNWYEKISKGKS